MTSENCRFKVEKEQQRQIDKFGNKVHDFDYWISILQEEIGEASKSRLEGDWKNVEIELTQVAALAMTMLEGIKEIEAETAALDSYRRLRTYICW